MAKKKSKRDDEDRGARCDCPDYYEKSSNKNTKFRLRSLKRLGGTIQVKTFIKSLDRSRRVKIEALLKRVANEGPPKNEEQSKKLVPGIFEFKASDVRIAWFYLKDHQILLAYGIIKKRRDWPKKEIAKVKEIRKEHKDNHET